MDIGDIQSVCCCLTDYPDSLKKVGKSSVGFSHRKIQTTEQEKKEELEKRQIKGSKLNARPPITCSKPKARPYVYKDIRIMESNES